MNNQNTLLELLDRYCMKRHFEDDEPIYFPGDPLNNFYYVADGQVELFCASDKGTEKTMHLLDPGEFFGESAFFLKYDAYEYATCRAPSLIYIITRETYHQSLEKEKLFRDHLTQSTARKQIRLTKEFENVIFLSAKERLINLFCSFSESTPTSERGWHYVANPYTHYELSVVIGVSRVTVSKLIQELCNENSIRIINRKVYISSDHYMKYLSSNIL